MAADGSVIIEIDGDDSKLNKTLGQVEKSSTAGLKSIGASVAKGIAAGAAAAGAAVVALGKMSIEAYANYEQLVGGVETLFKGSASVVTEYAANAYKTAGMSANTYMETVTSFSASLLQSLKGDTAAAAKSADMAITDMADNANKMGSNISSIQDAYQGFAKQNYTMLDNLKLGYGGTKEEMERLLADAEKLSGQKYDIKNLNDVYEAIHVVQTELGITGTTAKEASSTISGSADSMKAAWENFLVGLADGDQNLNALLDNLVESIGVFAGNLIPRIEEVVSNLASILSSRGGEIATALSDVITGAVEYLIEGMPQFVELAFGMITSLNQGISEAAPQIINGLTAIVTALIDGLSQTLPVLLPAGFEMVVTLVGGIVQAAPQIVVAALQLVATLVESLITSGTQLLQSGTELVNNISEGLQNGSGDFLAKVGDIILRAVDSIIQNAPAFISAAAQLVKALVTGVISNAPSLIQGAISLVAKLASGIVSRLPEIISAAARIVVTLLQAVISNAPKLLAGAVRLVAAIAGGIVGALGKVATAGWELVKRFAGAVGEKVSSLVSVGSDLVRGIATGIRNAVRSVTSAIGSVIGSAVDAGRRILRINSPSKETRDKLGLPISEGIAAGISMGKNFVLQAQKELFDNILASSKHLVEVVNGELSRMQEVIQKRQADKELADHKKAIEEKYRELGKAEKKEKQKILDDIAKLEADWNDKQLQAQEAAQQKALQATISGIETVQKEYESARDAIQRDIESLSEKLADNGGLFTRDKDGYLSINNLKDQRAEIERYGQVLDDLKKRGASQEFLSEITAMGVEDGLAFAEKLAKMGEKQLETYLADWEAVQAASRLVAEKFYADQVEAVDEKFSTKLAEEVGKIPEDMKSVGIDSIQGLIDGMLSMESTLSATAAAIVRQAINAMQMEADIHSPSKKTRDLVGKPMGQGVGVGFKEALPDMMRQARAVIEQHTAQLSAFAAAKANAGSNFGGASEVRTYYQRERIENTPSLNFTGDLAALMRILYPHWENEYKRRGRRMITGGAMA